MQQIFSIVPIAILGGVIGLDVVSFPQAMISRPIVAATLGGAFVGIDKIVGLRKGKRQLGLQANIPSQSEESVSKLLAQVEPEDLIKFGRIPECSGRLPIIATLEELDENALIEILK